MTSSVGLPVSACSGNVPGTVNPAPPPCQASICLLLRQPFCKAVPEPFPKTWHRQTSNETGPVSAAGRRSETSPTSPASRSRPSRACSTTGPTSPPTPARRAPGRPRARLQPEPRRPGARARPDRLHRADAADDRRRLLRPDPERRVRGALRGGHADHPRPHAARARPRGLDARAPGARVDRRRDPDAAVGVGGGAARAAGAELPVRRRRPDGAAARRDPVRLGDARVRARSRRRSTCSSSVIAGSPRSPAPKGGTRPRSG